VIEALDAFPHRRRTAVYGTAGDRRDADMILQGEMLGNAFDRVILFEEDNCIRGRKPGEINAQFKVGLATSQRVREVEEVYGAMLAVEAALRTVLPGDLVLVQVELVDQTIRRVRQHLAETKGRRVAEHSGAPARPRVAAAVAAV
jgi:cyanophycin synthetase